MVTMLQLCLLIAVPELLLVALMNWTGPSWFTLPIRIGAVIAAFFGTILLLESFGVSLGMRP